MEKNIPLYLMKDFSFSRNILLSLGSVCNMRCIHCGQRPIQSNESIVKEKVSDKTWQLIDNFIAYCIKDYKPLELSTHTVQFYGGETLLYWDVVKEIILHIWDKFGDVSRYNINLYIQSNGLLLTEDKVIFMNEHNVTFGFSYDAPYPFAVRDYVSDEICDLVQKIRKYTTNSVCNAINYDNLLISRCVKAKFPRALHHKVCFELLRSFAMPEYIYKYDWESYRSVFKKIRIASQLGDEYSLNFINTFIERILRKRTDLPQSLYILHCITEKDRMDTFSVTPSGNFMFCQNSNHILGTIDESISDLVEKRYSMRSDFASSQCDTCEYVAFCDHMCPLNMRNKDGSYVVCNDFYKPFFETVKSEFAHLTEPLTNNDLIWYYEQTKVMDKQVEMFLNEGQRYKEEHIRLPKNYNIIG